MSALSERARGGLTDLKLAWPWRLMAVMVGLGYASSLKHGPTHLAISYGVVALGYGMLVPAKVARAKREPFSWGTAVIIAATVVAGGVWKAVRLA